MSVNETDDAKKELNTKDSTKQELTNTGVQISVPVQRKTYNKVLLWAYIFMVCMMLVIGKYKVTHITEEENI